MSLNLQDSRCQLTPEELNSSKPQASTVWRRLSGLERRLAAVVCSMTFFSFGLMIALILLIISGGNWSPSEPEYDVCTTKECVLSASALMEVMNENVDPCDDFYEFACGQWQKKYPIPPDKTRFGTFDFVRKELKRNLKNILESPEVDTEPEAVRKAKRMYRACYNETFIENQSLSPLEALLTNYSGWPMTNPSFWASHKKSFNWFQNLGKLRQYGFSYLISAYVYTDTKSTNRSIIYIDQSGTGLGRIYLMNKTKYAKHIESYKKLMFRVAKLFGADDDNKLHKDVNAVVEFETRLAQILVPPEQRRNKTRMYNNMTIADLDRLTNNHLKWLPYLNTVLDQVEVLENTEEVIVVEPTYLKKLISLLREEDYNKTLANYVGWRLVKDMAWHMNTPLRSLLFEYAKNVSGLASQEPRWRSCAGLVNSLMGVAVAYPYVRENFKENSKLEANIMISHIREAFYELIEENNWMDDETKNKAKEKAAAIRQFIGYPPAILNTTEINLYYERLEVSEDRHFQNMMVSSRVETIKEFEELRKPVNKNRWVSQPGVVNAFYSPTSNSITFPAGILQPPFFLAGRIAAMNYGGIGSVIGHEITHGFDDKGRQMDKDGNIQEWWPREVVDNYLERADCIRKQYSRYCPVELKHNDQCLNGNSTLGENIADNGGLKEAYRAYKNWVHKHGTEPRLPGMTSYTPEQIFFLSFASTWCGSYRTAALESQILYGSHSPGRYRVIGTLSNSEDFAKVFKCSPETAMNRGDKRCVLW